MLVRDVAPAVDELPRRRERTPSEAKEAIRPVPCDRYERIESPCVVGHGQKTILLELVRVDIQ